MGQLKAQSSATGWVAHLHLSGENLLCIACLSLGTDACEAGFEGQNSAVTSLSHLLRLTGCWRAQLASDRLAAEASASATSLKFPAEVVLEQTHTPGVIWKFIWEPTIFLNSGPTGTKEKTEIGTGIPLTDAQQHSGRKREPLLSSSCLYLLPEGGSFYSAFTLGAFPLLRRYSRCRTRTGKRKTCSLL